MTDPGQAECLCEVSWVHYLFSNFKSCAGLSASTSHSPQGAAVVTWRFLVALSNEWNCRQRGSVALLVGQAGGREERWRWNLQNCFVTVATQWRHFFGGGKFKLVLHVCSLQIYLVPNPHCVDWQHWSRDSASCPSWGCGASEFPELPSLRENFKSWLFVEMVSDPFFLN